MFFRHPIVSAILKFAFKNQNSTFENLSLAQTIGQLTCLLLRADLKLTQATKLRTLFVRLLKFLANQVTSQALRLFCVSLDYRALA